MIKKERLFILAAGAVVFLVLLVTTDKSQITGEPLPTPEKRLFMSLAWAQQLPDAKAAADYAAACKERGLNGCGMQILWSNIEPSEGKFTWEWLDERLDALVDAGMQVHLRLAIYRQLPGWLKPEFMRGPDGAVIDMG